MPAKSKRQFRFMYAAYKRGEISKATLDDFTKGVKYKDLPDSVKKKKKKKRATTEIP